MHHYTNSNLQLTRVLLTRCRYSPDSGSEVPVFLLLLYAFYFLVVNVALCSGMTGHEITSLRFRELLMSPGLMLDEALFYNFSFRNHERN